MAPLVTPLIPAGRVRFAAALPRRVIGVVSLALPSRHSFRDGGAERLTTPHRGEETPMALRTRHGNARQYGDTPILETLPIDELPEGVPADTRTTSPSDRGPRGRFAAGNALAALGGRAKAGTSKLARRLGLTVLPEDSAFRSYKSSAETFRRVTSASLAASVGGGYCGPIPSSMIASAALALAWSRYYLDAAATLLEVDPSGAAKMVDQGTKLAEASSSLVRQAHEYAAREAVARAKRAGPVDLSVFYAPPEEKR